MATILISFDVEDDGLELLAPDHTIIRPERGRDFSERELAERIAEADVLCTVFNVPVSADLLDRAPKLRLIANYGVGYNNLPIARAQELGISVTNTPQAVIVPTAELTLALMLATARRVGELDRLVRQHPGERVPMGRMDYLGSHLAGKTLGLVGYGNIAEAVAVRARAFGMKILYNKRHRLDTAHEEGLGLTYAPLRELLQHSDIVSLHTPYSAETHHLIGAEELALMPSHALLINTARGAVIDEAALVDALQRGVIAGAGLDVYEAADVPAVELLSMDNVTLTPHTGTQTLDARRAIAREMCSSVAGFLAGRRDMSLVVRGER